MSQITFFGRGCGALDNAISNACVVPTSAVGVGTYKMQVAGPAPTTRRLRADGLQALRGEDLCGERSSVRTKLECRGQEGLDCVPENSIAERLPRRGTMPIGTAVHERTLAI